MSVSFWGITENGDYIPGNPELTSGCLCSQLAPTWDMYLEGSDLEELAQEADQNCPWCHGTGVESPHAMVAEVNFASANARDILYLMGLADASSPLPLNTVVIPGEDDQEILAGEIPVPNMRQRIMVARASFDNKVGMLERSAEEIKGEPYTDEDDVAHIHPVRVTVPAKTSDRIYERLEDVASFVEDMASKGAQNIRWG